MNIDAVVLVGGQGTRLRPLTLSAPKPMLPTAGVPFLEHLLSRIRAAGLPLVPGPSRVERVVGAPGNEPGPDAALAPPDVPA